MEGSVTSNKNNRQLAYQKAAQLVKNDMRVHGLTVALVARKARLTNRKLLERFLINADENETGHCKALSTRLLALLELKVWRPETVEALNLACRYDDLVFSGNLLRTNDTVFETL
jgi:hypothetical protein